ncbi:putative pterin-binding protein [Celerinatantimonas diazotrophica]|uniref:Oxidoreductase molybdopterin-binding domain-containing protein n=1 Tax=Celerinatantimonas diazotrophica TaxID=412034 RepID=A0A4R1K279_9GAMM|nr:molybdopterin-binding oxidoreductase [Celerinatantimonas diazotrophica]TCK57927.1 hypothetical protein EV690_1629 [Celerinatantimonas diazotrophica]CAG9298005.1 hypothetical protein CEDIAZO_03200 [Celerinatantimonas diazotrophica]
MANLMSRCAQVMVFLALCAWGKMVYASEPIILTISGHIRPTLSVRKVNFTLNDLQKFPQYIYKTTNRWVDKPHQYKGPLLADILKSVHAESPRLTLVALNDYRVNMDMSKVIKYKPILAWSDDGKTMTVRDRGPLWLMFPLDSYPKALKNTGMNTYMIWQLRKIIVNQ